MTKQEFLVMDEKSRYDYMISIGWIADENGQVWSHKGKPVGSVDKTEGYIKLVLTLEKRKHATLRAHRFVFYYLTKQIPDTIDHINQIRTDNRICNLRSVTNQENSFNTKAKGYSFNKSLQKYIARIRVNNELIYLGIFDTKEDARQAYLEAKKTYHII